MATQLEQLLAQLDRPGVSELTLCVGKPITMRTQKGVLNVTGRALGSDQLASLVRGTPLEALIADAATAAAPVQLALGQREVVVEVEHGNDETTLRLRPGTDGARPRGRTRSKSSKPPSRKAASTRPAPEPTRQLPRAGPSPAPAPKPAPPSTDDELALPRTMTARPSGVLIPPAFPARPRQASAAPPGVAPIEPAPAPPAPELDPRELDIELPPPRKKAPSIGPPALDVGASSRAFDLEPSPQRPSTGRLRIDVSHVGESPPTAHESSGIIQLDRGPGMPLSHETRSLEALGLPPDIIARIARDRGLVLITAAHGHGKTSTLAALFDRIDRGVVPHVVTIDELRDRESVDLALTTAESGYFVLATLTAGSPAGALDTLLHHYPGMAHGRVRTRLAAALSAVIAKRLPPTPSEIVTGSALQILLG